MLQLCLWFVFCFILNLYSTQWKEKKIHIFRAQVYMSFGANISDQKNNWIFQYFSYN